MSLAELPVIATAPGRDGPVDLSALQTTLARDIEGEFRCDRLSRALYSTDASVYQIVPLGVVLPKTEADVIATVKQAAARHIPITARGGGTSQAGQAIGPGLVLDFSRYMDQVLEISAPQRWVRVQPGCVLDDLNAQLRPHGLQFAPDVSTANRATIGGMIANNSCGAHSLIYGKTVDHVLELRVVLSDGSAIDVRRLNFDELMQKIGKRDLEGSCYRTVIELAKKHVQEIMLRFPNILRRVGGYNLDLYAPIGRAYESGAGGFNLAGIFVGSEGTLGITVEAKLQLVELPRAKDLLVAHFADLLDALAATPAILAHQPAAVEVVDRTILDSTRLNPEASRLRGFLHGDPGAILIIEFYGASPGELTPRLDALEADLRQRGAGYHHHRAIEASAQADIWKLRKAALGLSMAQKGDAKALSFVEDTAVTPEHLRDYIAEFLAIVARHGTTAGVYAHASVGCLHVRPVVNLKTEAGVSQFESIALEVAGLVLKYGGSLSGEHGDGLVRSPFQEKMYGPKLYGAFRELKRTFDPENILNPGKIVNAPALTANLRYGAGYVTPEVPTTFDFSADGGLARAAELCAGVGACRKKREGTMCPSYQATREEQHSTRGRANALRLALTGQLGLAGLTDPAVCEVLDLCLECKACKSECPTNVDMARLKAEFLHQYYAKHGLPWRNWIFGNVAVLGRWGSRWAPLSNWLSRNIFTRWANDKLLGIDRRRLPPRFARGSYLRRRAQHPAGTAVKNALLFCDTFVHYFEPALARKAQWLLELAGWQIDFTDGRDSKQPRVLCCGRPLISNGLLTQAVAHAERNVNALHPWAGAGHPIFACEPSCILTIKDDYPALVRPDLHEKAVQVAAACLTFEELLLRPTGSTPRFRPGPGKILVQAHCHQRALAGMRPLLNLLRLIPGAEVVDLDAGCCGMAGSFGYEKEHYEVSRLVGEQRLFPALREAAPETVVVAPGFSCRMQIQHFTGRTALHPAELLFDLLDEPSAR